MEKSKVGERSWECQEVGWDTMANKAYGKVPAEWVTFGQILKEARTWTLGITGDGIPGRGTASPFIGGSLSGMFENSKEGSAPGTACRKGGDGAWGVNWGPEWILRSSVEN